MVKDIECSLNLHRIVRGHLHYRYSAWNKFGLFSGALLCTVRISIEFEVNEIQGKTYRVLIIDLPLDRCLPHPRYDLVQWQQLPFGALRPYVTAAKAATPKYKDTKFRQRLRSASSRLCSWQCIILIVMLEVNGRGDVPQRHHWMFGSPQNYHCCKTEICFLFFCQQSSDKFSCKRSAHSMHFVQRFKDLIIMQTGSGVFHSNPSH